MSRELTLRRAPVQERSRRTFQRLLDVTSELLEELGFDAFNTNLLAERSGIGTRAIYRYFPNKYALVSELAGRMAGIWRADLAAIAGDTAAVWPDIWFAYLDTYVQAVRTTPGGLAVLRAMRTHQELRQVDEAFNERYTRDVAKALCERNPRLTPARARLAAITLLRSTVAIVDASLDESPAAARRLLEMLKIMHAGLLAECLAPDAWIGCAEREVHASISG